MMNDVACLVLNMCFLCPRKSYWKDTRGALLLRFEYFIKQSKGDRKVYDKRHLMISC